MRAPAAFTKAGRRAGPPVRQSPHYVLFVLYLVCAFSYVDRQLIALLAPAIQHDLRLDDAQVGFVSGTAFAVLYVFLGIPLSRLADRTHRVRMLGICLLVWSLMTAICGAAVGFVQLALARVGVAVGEAGGYPTSLAVISDVYPPEGRATATSFFLSGTMAGAFVSMVAGGAIDQMVGWRWTFVLAAAPVLLLLPVLLTVREPMRGQSDPPGTVMVADRIGHVEAFRLLFRTPVYRWVMIGGAVANLEIFALAAWAPTYVLRTFHLSIAAVGLGLGLALGVGSGLVLIAGGWVSDRLTRRAPAAAIYVAAAGQLLFIPPLLLALGQRDFPVFCAIYAAAYGLVLMNGPLNIAATQSAVPAQVRGTAAALLVMASTLVGYGIGPPLIGAISDAMTGADPAERLRHALSIGVLFNVIGAVIMTYAARAATKRAIVAVA